jgi:hypothetical protein
MSYLRGPLTRDQIATLMADQKVAAPTAPPTASVAPPPSADGAPAAVNSTAPAAPGAMLPPPSGAPSSVLPPDVTAVMPGVAEGVLVRWVDPAAPWVSTAGGDPRGTVRAAAVVARVALRYDETKADLVHDEEYEAVLFPLSDPIDVTTAGRGRLRRSRPAAESAGERGLPDPRRAGQEQDVLDAPGEGPPRALVRTRSLDLFINRDLKLCSRPGEDAAAFEQRCLEVADVFADAEIGKFREKYAAKASKLQDQLRVAEDRVDVIHGGGEGPPQRGAPLHSRLDPRRHPRRPPLTGVDPLEGRLCRRPPVADRRRGQPGRRLRRTRSTALRDQLGTSSPPSSRS